MLKCAVFERHPTCIKYEMYCTPKDFTVNHIPWHNLFGERARVRSDSFFRSKYLESNSSVSAHSTLYDLQKTNHD